MEQVAYSQEVGALLVACDLPVADLRDDVWVKGSALTKRCTGRTGNAALYSQEAS